jgi:hypothetical protein
VVALVQTAPRPRRTVPVQVTAVRPHGVLRKADTLVSEETLEIRVSGPNQCPQTVGVTMRIPGNDFTDHSDGRAGVTSAGTVMATILSARWRTAPPSPRT